MTLPDMGLEHGSFDWDAIDARFDWVRALRGCRQDPVYHAEGDVWIHTRMVLTELTQLAEFQELEEEAQWITFAAALLHDVGKPEIPCHLAPKGVEHPARLGALLWQAAPGTSVVDLLADAPTRIITPRSAGRGHHLRSAGDSFFLARASGRRSTASRCVNRPLAGPFSQERSKPNSPGGWQKHRVRR